MKRTIKDMDLETWTKLLDSYVMSISYKLKKLAFEDADAPPEVWKLMEPLVEAGGGRPLGIMTLSMGQDQWANFCSYTWELASNLDDFEVEVRDFREEAAAALVSYGLADDLTNGVAEFMEIRWKEGRVPDDWWEQQGTDPGPDGRTFFTAYHVAGAAGPDGNEQNTNQEKLYVRAITEAIERAGLDPTVHVSEEGHAEHSSNLGTMANEFDRQIVNLAKAEPQLQDFRSQLDEMYGTNLEGGDNR